MNKPAGLNNTEFEILQKLSNEYAKVSLAKLIKSSRQYTEKLETLSKTNGLLNFKLAKKIYETILEIDKCWKDFPLDVQYWFKGAIAYYFLEEDEENDISSAIGFDDDAQVLNACLRLAAQNEFIIRIEDFD